MIRTKPAIALALIVTLSACQTTGTPEAPIAMASIALADGTAAGTARLSDAAGTLTLSVSLHDIPPGERAMHLHTTGSCVGPDFQSAGAHLNPDGKQHGTRNPMGAHLGDLPNVTAGSDGRVELSIPIAGNPAELEKVLFDADGTAIVVHAGPDDMVTDPAGNAGKRVACGQLLPA